MFDEWMEGELLSGGILQAEWAVLPHIKQVMKYER